jgi:ElaB/YqjD/DUF883 family membrane-anchored ribosome-binding protein
MDRESPEMIEEQMRHTRSSLQAKLAAAEEKVTCTVRQATGAVESAAHTVKETVDDSLHQVRETMSSAAAGVRRAFDLRQHVRDDPWLGVGGAAGVGFVVGLLIPDGNPRSRAGHTAIPASTPPAKWHGGGWLSEVMELAQREAMSFAETLIRSFSAALRDKVADASPRIVEDAIAAAVPRFGHRHDGQDWEDEAAPLGGQRRSAC